MEEAKLAVEKEEKVVRYVGSIDVKTKDTRMKVKFEMSHPIAALKGRGDFISFYTKRYGYYPLNIRQAGAGREVTAMGVTGELFKVLERLS